jgi:hypothetical protein
MARAVAISCVLAVAALFAAGQAASSSVVRTRGNAYIASSSTQMCPAWPSGSGLLVDGDFSQATYPGSSWITFRKGAKFAPLWRVDKHTIDFVGGYFKTPSGVCSIDLDGDFEIGSIGGVTHAAFPTVSRSTYTVSFLFSGNGFGAPTIKTMRVSAAGQSQEFTWNVSSGNDAQNGVFQVESWSFVAAGSRTWLTFGSLDPKRSCCGPVIAAVAVTRNQ